MNKKLKIAGIVFSILSILFLLVGFVPLFYPELTTNNTTEFEATFLSYELKDNSTYIRTEEYNTNLIIADNEQIDNINELTSLNPNTKIYFRIENEFLSNLQSSEFIYIVSLRTETGDILTLESYNNEYLNSKKIAQNTAFIFTGIFLISAIVCFYFYKNKKTNG